MCCNRGTPEIEVTFEVDANGILNEEIERMVREAEEFAEEDYLEAWRRIGWMTINDKDKLADKLESDEKEKIETATKEAPLQWLQFSQILVYVFEVLSTNTMEILSLEIERHYPDGCYLLEAGNQYKCLTQHLAMEGFSNWAKVWGLRICAQLGTHLSGNFMARPHMERLASCSS
nr:luminal-binding protein 5 [Ipomoea batatas]